MKVVHDYSCKKWNLSKLLQLEAVIPVEGEVIKSQIQGHPFGELP